MFPQPDLYPINGREYVLLQPFVYTGTVRGKRCRFTIPKGDVTDGASAPRLLWTPFGIRPDGLYRAGAVTHDYLYQYRGRPPEGTFEIFKDGKWVAADLRATFKLSTDRDLRQFCDDLFKQIMQEAGVPGWQCQAMYLAVRWFGGRAWNR